jgi:hypothetical protein
MFLPPATMQIQMDDPNLLGQLPIVMQASMTASDSAVFLVAGMRSTLSRILVRRREMHKNMPSFWAMKSVWERVDLITQGRR